MGKALAALLLLTALTAEVVFFLTGAGTAPVVSTPITQALPPQLVGTPWLAVSGGVVFLLGALLAGRRAKGEDYATREVVLAVSVFAATGFAAAVVLGAIRQWSYPTLGVLSLGGCVETVVASVLCVRVATTEDKVKLLFVPSLLATIPLAVFYLLLIVLGTG